MLLGGDVRACIAYSETDNEVENIVKDALDNDKSRCTWPGYLFFNESMRSSVVVAQAAAHRLICSQAVAGGNDEVGRTDESTKPGAHDLGGRFYEIRGKQCLQRDVTEVDVSRRGAGRTCLMFIVTRVV